MAPIVSFQVLLYTVIKDDDVLITIVTRFLHSSDFE